MSGIRYKKKIKAPIRSQKQLGKACYTLRTICCFADGTAITIRHPRSGAHAERIQQIRQSSRLDLEGQARQVDQVELPAGCVAAG
jgi:hypothetical protein